MNKCIAPRYSSRKLNIDKRKKELLFSQEKCIVIQDNDLLSTGLVGNKRHCSIQYNTICHSQFLKLALFLSLRELYHNYERW